MSDPGRGRPEVSILVVSYNTREMTLACLRSVVAETRADWELIVVDNASADGSAEAIREAFAGEPRLSLTAEARNHGFAAANNLAAAAARGDRLLLLNPDTLILDGAVDRLLAFARTRPEAGIWGGRTVFADGAPNPASCWGRMTLWSVFCRASGLTGLLPRSEIFNPEAMGAWPRDRERAVDIVSGCFLMIDRALWTRLGGFDPTYVMYAEEADLCDRARALGARPRVTPEACIVHHGGASETVRADRVVRILKGKATIIRRRFPRWQRPLALALHGAWPATRLLFARLARRPAAAALWREVRARRADWLAGW